MSIVLLGSTSGSITLQEPAVAGSTVLSLPAVSGTILTTTSPKAGNVIQVVSATYGTQISSSSSTWADTGLTASITPTSSSSKILVITQLQACGKQTGNTYLGVKLVRGSTDIQIMESLAGYDNSTGANWIGSISSTYLDSPATTSNTTYKIQFISAANVATVYINGNSGGLLPVSTITLMEIAA